MGTYKYNTLTWHGYLFCSNKVWNLGNLFTCLCFSATIDGKLDGLNAVTKCHQEWTKMTPFGMKSKIKLNILCSFKLLYYIGLFIHVYMLLTKRYSTYIIKIDESVRLHLNDSFIHWCVLNLPLCVAQNCMKCYLWLWLLNLAIKILLRTMSKACHQHNNVKEFAVWEFWKPLNNVKECYKPKPVACKNELGNYSNMLTMLTIA